MCITWYTGDFREEEDERIYGHWTGCLRFVVEAGEKKRIYFHFASSRDTTDYWSEHVKERIQQTNLWRSDENHESCWLRMDIPIQRHEKGMCGSDGGIWRTLVMYKMMDTFKKGKLDMTKKIRMTITSKNRTSADIGKSGRHWILDGILQEALDTNHGAIRQLKIETARSTTAKSNRRKKAKKEKKMVTGL